MTRHLTHLLTYSLTHSRTHVLTWYFVCWSGEPDAADARRRSREHGERGARAAGEGGGHAGSGGQLEGSKADIKVLAARPSEGSLR